MQPIYLSWFFAGAILLATLTRLWLASRQIRHVAQNGQQIPALFVNKISLQAHQRAANYTIAKLRFGMIVMLFECLVLLGWTLLNGLNWLNTSLRDALAPSWGNMVYQLGLLTAFALISGLLDLPFSWWSTFRLEQRYGFNHTSPKIWLSDLFKNTLVGALLALPLIWSVLWLMQRAGSMWWLWGWAVWASFSLLLMLIYPTFIAPLFNKFEPLQDPPIKNRVENLIQRCGFTAKGLFVMDGSRRSAHANAYFTGLGSAKRVVFFDTLLKTLTPGEVEAVLAHELGHFKYKHVLQRLVSMLTMGLGIFALLGWLSKQVWFYMGFGIQPNLTGATNDALALLIIMLVAPTFSFFLAPLFASVSRHHEYQADAYACQQTRKEDLSTALLKLYEDNASTLTPDPLYVKFYYSHPPALERLTALHAIN